MSEIDDFTRYVKTGDPGGLTPAPRSGVAFVDIPRSPGELRELAARFRHQSAVLLSSAETCESRAAEIENRTPQSKLEHARTNGAGE